MSELGNLNDIKDPYKPDFMINPHRYFRDRDAPPLADIERHVPTLAESKF